MPTLNAVWVNGNTVRSKFVHDNLQQVRGTWWEGNDREIPWSDVNGLPRGWGATFRGKRANTGGLSGSTTGPFDVDNPFKYSQKGYWFHYAIPTPVILQNVRLKLTKVFTLYDASPGISIACVHVWDGPKKIAAISSGFPRPTPLPFGAGGTADLREGVNMYTLPTPKEVLFGICISMAVMFPNDGDITFVSGGADFIS